MSDVNLTLQDNGGVYLAITETPAVVTLSQAVISGALASTVTVANVVTVALDSNSLAALENVTVTVGSAITGTVAVSNLPSVTTVAGTVAVNNFPASQVVSVSNFPSSSSVTISNFPITQVVSVSNFPQSSSVTIANFPSVTTVTGTVALDQASLIALENVTVTVGSTVSISNLPATQTIAGTVTANAFGIIDYGDNTYQQAQLNLAGHEAGFGSGVRLGVSIIANDGGEYGSVNLPFRVNGTVTVGNSVTIGSLPAISGTVTANVTNSVTIGSLPVQLSTTTIGGTSRLNVTLSSATTVGNTTPSYANLYGGSDGTNLRAILTDTSGRTVVTVSNFPSTQPVSLASLPSLAAGTAQIGSVTASISGTVPVSGTFWQATQPVSGTVTAAVVSTTVTVSALPSGALTTRFGSVTTANTPMLTAAVTNSARRYLLAQNISAGTVTIGIGFSPTTTQGIQLSAGGGLSFDAFCPTGAVWWLSSTTGANFTILEG